MMTNLRESTGSPAADKILQGVVGILEQVFPDRVHGYFVRGSYASATSTQGSDLDMFVVFKDAFAEPAEAKKARDICGLPAPVNRGDANRVTARQSGQCAPLTRMLSTR